MEPLAGESAGLLGIRLSHLRRGHPYQANSLPSIDTGHNVDGVAVHCSDDRDGVFRGPLTFILVYGIVRSAYLVRFLFWCRSGLLFLDLLSRLRFLFHDLLSSTLAISIGSLLLWRSNIPELCP